MERQNSNNENDDTNNNKTLPSTKEKKEEDSINRVRSTLSLEGGKKPFSLYTRRVINTEKIREYLKENSTHGLCGGINLGNTCFMNSSIACLSNCIELTCYFLSGDYIKDINKENKNGMGGKLAESWGELLQEYWVEHTRVGDPTNFKKIFGQKIKRFSGFSQQDSNEFIDLFLDYLNEDLKSTNNNKYLELKEKGENETDKECSKRYWDYYLKRNDSIVTDLFCGQLKCTLTCPKCNLINITFDPFNTLNLSIPEITHNKYFRTDLIEDFSFFYVPKYCIRTPVRIVFEEILKKATFKDCFRCLKNQQNFKYHETIDKLVITEISEKKLIQILNQEDNTSIKEYRKNYIFCYDIMDEKENINIPIYFKDYKGYSEFPRIIMVSAENSNLDDFRKKIYFNIRKLILSPLKKKNEEIDSLSSEIKNYTTNIEIKDEYIFDLINKEYQEVFNSSSNLEEDDEKSECINNFIKNIPFKIYLTKDLNDNNEEKIYILNEKNFLNVSSEFTKLTDIKDYNESIKNLLNILKNENYYVVLELKRNSEYINEKLYKLNNCVKCACDYSEEKAEEPEENVITLKKCFELFTKEEDLSEGDEWYCPKCKEHVLAKKKMEIYYLPKILIICFKRFTRHKYYWERNNELIYFPIENLNMEEFVTGPDKEHSIYDLFGVSQHYGGTGFGHYTAICKNFDNWYSYNDSSVHSTKQENILSEAAYVLFYRRKTD